MDYLRSQLPNLIYLAGSLCFAAGTLLNMWRARG